MGSKKVIGLLVLIVGVILIIFALYEKNRISNAKGTISEGRSMMPDNQMTGAVGGMLEKQVGQYDAPVLFCLIGGIVLAVIGGGMVICCRKKHR